MHKQTESDDFKEHSVCKPKLRNLHKCRDESGQQDKVLNPAFGESMWKTSSMLCLLLLLLIHIYCLSEKRSPETAPGLRGDSLQPGLLDN